MITFSYIAVLEGPQKQRIQDQAKDRGVLHLALVLNRETKMLKGLYYSTFNFNLILQGSLFLYSKNPSSID